MHIKLDSLLLRGVYQATGPLAIFRVFMTHMTVMNLDIFTYYLATYMMTSPLFPKNNSQGDLGDSN